MWNSYNPVPYEFADHPYISPFHFPAQFDGAIYNSEEFFMYNFKVKRCPRTRNHDWTGCPFAHPGETAGRRDPCRFGYCAIPCPEFRHTGACMFGDACLFAHGVFEHWLHPEMYRTRMCTSRLNCQRQVCFFAHTLQELRAGEPTKCHYVHEPWPEVPTELPWKGLVETSPMAAPSPVARPAAQASTPPAFPECALSAFTGGNDFLASLSGIRAKGGEDKGKSVYVSDEAEPNFLNISWVEEVVVD